MIPLVEHGVIGRYEMILDQVLVITLNYIELSMEGEDDSRSSNIKLCRRKSNANIWCNIEMQGHEHESICILA